MRLPSPEHDMLRPRSSKEDVIVLAGITSLASDLVCFCLWRQRHEESSRM